MRDNRCVDPPLVDLRLRPEADFLESGLVVVGVLLAKDQRKTVSTSQLPRQRLASVWLDNHLVEPRTFGQKLLAWLFRPS